MFLSKVSIDMSNFFGFEGETYFLKLPPVPYRLHNKIYKLHLKPDQLFQLEFR